jgi:ferritin-like metal-binding protein YciE
MMLLRFSGKRFPFIKKANSDKQLKELFRAIDQLKKEYKKLDSMIKEDPELKKLIEKKLSEIDGNKIKL